MVPRSRCSLAGGIESRIEELEARKRLCNGDSGPLDEIALGAIASELYRLTHMNVDEVIAAWETARKAEPGQIGRAHV